MESQSSSRSSSPTPTPPPEKKLSGRNKPRNEKQMAALRKGMDALKAKRETMAKEKEERKKTNEELKAKGLPPIEPPMKLKKKEIVEMKPLEPVVLKVRKPRADKGVEKGPREKDPMKKPISKEEFAQMRDLVNNLKSSVPTEKIVDRPVEIVKEIVKEVPVEKTKVISGSQLLDAIFFGKKG